MLSDIFSSFDPSIVSSSLFFATPIWTSCMIILLLLNASFWAQPSRNLWTILSSTNIMWEQMTRTTGIQIKGLSSFIIPLFLSLILINLLGLVPYVFSLSSHLLLALSLGLPLWLMLMISSILYSPKKFTAHLLPAGAPLWLSPALILIEMTSTLIRPITLSFRLVANMTAGHIVLGLMGIYLSFSTFSGAITSSTFIFLIQAGYMLFEMGICLIQAFIFCLLLSLYSDDHPL
uniref:ATP synthase F0 subunit 6 n=1 Tax=Sternaspis sendalli TaxID=2607893 RepID=UPI00226CB495|nr:ATP synthase F0 subunit 6 [Sternaspis sendalli]UZP47203.1 ATP synthase F0 subunit 6 [Sternaspis sendalli]